ncbi:MAG: hypothetical protein ACE37K_06155 [Planctomycetota bacterium]
MSKDQLVRFRNMRRQPVELHCHDRVLVVPPLGEVELTDEQAAVPQIAFLIRARHLSSMVASSTPPKKPPTSAQSTPGRAATKKPRNRRKAEASKPAKPNAKGSGRKKTTKPEKPKKGAGPNARATS